MLSADSTWISGAGGHTPAGALRRASPLSSPLSYLTPAGALRRASPLSSPLSYLTPAGALRRVSGGAERPMARAKRLVAHADAERLLMLATATLERISIRS